MFTITRRALLNGMCVSASLGAIIAGGPATAQRIMGAGATFPAPIYKKWFQAYTQAHPTPVRWISARRTRP
jgi:ABC-type phosphate transport system substrate-binding protein